MPAVDIAEPPKFKFDVVNTKIMKYANSIMRIFGFYHHKSDRLILKVYPIFVLFIMWFNTLRCFSSFNFFYNQSEPFSAELVLKIVTILWLFSCSANTTVIYINQAFSCREAELIKTINTLLEANQDCKRIVDQASRHINLIFLISLAIGFFNQTAFLVSMFGPKEMRSLFILILAPFHRTDWAVESIPFKMFSAFLFIFMSLSWTLNVAYYGSYCQIFIEILKNYNKRMSYFISNHVIIPSNENFPKPDPNDSIEKLSFAIEADFEELRLYHLKICNAIKILNKCYNKFIALTLLCYIPLICVILYAIADWNNNCITGLKSVAFPFWLVVGILIIVIIVNYGARINTLVNVLLCYMGKSFIFILLLTRLTKSLMIYSI